MTGRRNLRKMLRSIPTGCPLTVRWADAAEIRELSLSKIAYGRIPENLLKTIMTHSGRFMGTQREPASGKDYLLILLERNEKAAVAAIPIDLIIDVKVKTRVKRPKHVIKTPMLYKKYASGEVKSSGGVVKFAD